MNDVSAKTQDRARPLPVLPGFLFDNEENKAGYALKAWLLSLLPSLAIAAVIGLLIQNAEQPDIAVDGWTAFVLLAVITPFVETLIMIGPLLLLRRLFGDGPAILLNAIGWGIAHSLAAPVWGLVTWWPFLIFSAAFLTWKPKGWTPAILIVTAIHGLQNGVVGLSLLFG